MNDVHPRLDRIEERQAAQALEIAELRKEQADLRAQLAAMRATVSALDSRTIGSIVF